MKKTLKFINKIIFSKRFILLTTYTIIVLLSIVSSAAFSDFTNQNQGEAANIKVSGMNYNIVINGTDYFDLI